METQTPLQNKQKTLYENMDATEEASMYTYGVNMDNMGDGITMPPIKIPQANKKKKSPESGVDYLFRSYWSVRSHRPLNTAVYCHCY